MGGKRFSGTNTRQQRRWRFADCTFDEANWVLTVGGQRVPMESIPLNVLRELLMRAGELVSKEDLFNAVWPRVAVVEASLPTAMTKLRRALADHCRDTPIIETVSGIGYRLTIPVEVDELPLGAQEAGTSAAAEAGQCDPTSASYGVGVSRPQMPSKLRVPVWALAGALAGFVAIAVGYALAPTLRRPAPQASSLTQRDAANALRRLDIGAIEDMLAAGWSPNKAFDEQGNGAVNYVLDICEWDRRHDQGQLLLMVRTLIDGGAQLDRRNIWGDTPYSIAKAQRYCGPTHPVTNSLRTICYAGFQALGDRCLATYELGRRTN